MSGTPGDRPEPVLTNQAEADLYDWIALHRAERGGVARAGDRWLDGGHRVPGYVAESQQSPGERYGWRCWSRGCATRRSVAVCGVGVLAANGGGGRWGWTAQMW
jgi:hypothetical protein